MDACNLKPITTIIYVSKITNLVYILLIIDAIVMKDTT